jgi:hypothetical protein
MFDETDDYESIDLDLNSNTADGPKNGTHKSAQKTAQVFIEFIYICTAISKLFCALCILLVHTTLKNKIDFVLIQNYIAWIHYAHATRHMLASASNTLSI